MSSFKCSSPLVVAVVLPVCGFSPLTLFVSPASQTSDRDILFTQYGGIIKRLLVHANMS